ncbi:hypothetical protein EG328_002756 [Venturia inaequalis]|uniref:Uncharacterized protein n=1 Tax=Venturia inaequalis TaxID=5025 RepID=A0A8H3Z630_VENIN|nr:hypothetical protein EG328_002756 [Venturia inaequalis]
MSHPAVPQNSQKSVKLYQIEIDAKRELEEIRAAREEAVKADEAAIERAQRALGDPEELARLTLQRYQHMHQVVKAENDELESDPNKAREQLSKDIDAAQQAYMDEQKKRWRWIEEAQLTEMRAEEKALSLKKEKMAQDLQALQQSMQALQESVDRMERKGWQDEATIQSLTSQLEASERSKKKFADALDAQTEEWKKMVQLRIDLNTLAGGPREDAGAADGN